MRFDVELADPAHLESLLSSLKHLDGVFDAYRSLPGGGTSGTHETAEQTELADQTEQTDPEQADRVTRKMSDRRRCAPRAG